jgi:hypothetical protein
LTLLLLTAHAYAAEVTLAWDDPHNNPVEVGGYNLYYWQYDWDVPARVDVGKQTTYTLTNLEAGQTYYMAVTAHDGNGGGESAYSNVVYMSEIILTASPSTVAPGGTLTVSWAAPSGGHATDWIGLYGVDDPNTSYGWWSYTNGATSGSFTLSAPSQAGQYEFRYLLQNGFTDAAQSNAVTVSVPTSYIFAVNAGGPTYVDTAGIHYEADMLFSGGSIVTSTAPITGTEDDVLYQSARTGNFAYAIPLSNGDYVVTLQFAELSKLKPGRRTFDVLIEGQEVVHKLDLVATVGPKAAYDVEIPVRVTDGVLNIRFRRSPNDATVSAIVVQTLGY